MEYFKNVKRGDPLAPKTLKARWAFFWQLCTLGDPKLAEEMIMSMFKHMAGVHVFPDNKLFKACVHGPVDDTRRPLIPEGENN